MRQTVIASLLLALAAPAAAQDTTREVVTYDFMDDLVTGGRYEGEGARVLVRGGQARQSLIRARAHWVPELTKSVENL